MENFTVNITGDVNIILPHGKIPRRVRLKKDGYAPVSSFQLTPNDEEYDESNVSVLLAVPGQKAKSMRLLDALIATGFLCTHVRQVPTFDLYMAYEQKAVVTVSGETYLTGPPLCSTASMMSCGISLRGMPVWFGGSLKSAPCSSGTETKRSRPSRCKLCVGAYCNHHGRRRS